MPRKQHDYHFIYKTVNLVNENFYIGMHSTSNLEDGYIGSGKRLWYSIKKYGRENFKMEILEFLPDRSSLKLREKELVNESLLQDPLCMNLQLGGGGGFSSEEHRIKNLKMFSDGGHNKLALLWKNEEWRSKQSEIRKNYWKDENLSKKMIKGLDWTGKTHKQETRDKIGESAKISQKGEKNSQFGTCWIKHDEFGIKKIKKEELESFLLIGWKRGR
jgi:hypothetical protein